MTKILLVGKYGHDLSYFSKIRKYAKENLIYTVDVCISLPIFLLEIFKLLFTKFNRDEIDYISDFEIKRKIAKYGPKLKLWYIFSRNLLAKLYLIKYSNLLKTSKYNIICMWGGNKICQRAIKIAAQNLGVQVVIFENGCLPNSITCDFDGVNYENSVPRNKEFYDNIPP